MEIEIKKFIESLDKLVGEDLVSELYEITEPLEEAKDISESFDNIFRFFQRNKNADLGSPGPLVHLLESHYPKYVPNLIASLESEPAELTVFMLHRIMNSNISTSDKEKYHKLLGAISSNPTADEAAKSEAKHYYEYHA